jgi:hypothetical protein
MSTEERKQLLIEALGKLSAMIYSISIRDRQAIGKLIIENIKKVIEDEQEQKSRHRKTK